MTGGSRFEVGTAQRIAGRAVPLWKPLAGIALVAVLASLMSPYLLFVGTTAIVTGVFLLGLGVMTGSAGLMSMCTLSFAAVGAWVVSELAVLGAPGPFELWLVLGGLCAAPFGLLIGLPALRLRGIHFAVITLSFGVAVDAVLQARGFPGALKGIFVARPSGFESDPAYFVFCGVVLIVLATCVSLVDRSRVGASWRAVRASERATAAAGTSVARAKLTACAVGAFAAGIGGGLLTGQLGAVQGTSFMTFDSLVLFLVATLVGSQYIVGAVVGGITVAFLPELTNDVGVSQDWATFVFGVMGIYALAQGSSLGEDLPRLRRWLVDKSGLRPPTPGVARGRGGVLPAPGSPEMGRSLADRHPAGTELLRIENLGVAYGRIKALDGVGFTVEAGSVVGLIGPNGAGKSSLTDAVTGFISSYTGSVTLGGTVLDGLPPHRRAVAGLRRTFQQDRVPTTMMVGEYLRFVAGPSVTTADVEQVLQVIDGPASNAPVSQLDVGTRRMLEVAGVLLAAPLVAILDEPAAGLAQAEKVALADVIRRVPELFGTAVLLIEHDLELVRTACSTVTVLNFGRIIASGPTVEVLDSDEVAESYLGKAVTA